MASHLRQYMPAKPHKRGMKLFVLCDSYGFSYAFELYSGAGDNKVPSGVPDLGAASNVVSRLSQIIPDHKQHILYFDNYYTAIPLMIYLYSRGIFSLGTIRTNRIANCKLSTDKQVQKEKRGYSEEYVASCQGVDISTTLWKDNKCVRLASTYVGIKQFIKDNETEVEQKIARYDRVQKKRIEVDCPTIIREYNAHMGGVDLMDGLIGRYRIKMKTN
ncbi:piggyBac transposable element-derived protein 3-like [Harmonia axyridis]|uniref:piggyBac transposable element-derived protein 3-like n=1 Tax=Harmonia axyridis TaxID=115357 RepID=UPI001E278C05|nr:piggyBac transposable element-derived protein 3-like [Harmonia axyridis]